MSDRTTVVAHAFAKNRAEELGFDLWNEFVMPLYFNQLSLDEVRKPIVFEGGRGCGKTTLLRYLSYATQLSEKRELKPESLPKQIGLYLRADTQYMRTFRGDTLTNSQWEKAFEHDLCLSIVSEFLGALKLLNSGPRRVFFEELHNLDMSAWGDFDSTAPSDLEGLTRHIRLLQNRFAMWLNNPEDEGKPQFLPMKRVILELIGAVQRQVPYLTEIVFFVFIDEYENLLDYQMRIINTHIKHSEAPLIFHIATKRNGMATRETLSTERLQERDDFRRFDVEKHLESDFPLFAAELFCFRLRKKGIRIGSELINEGLLCSIEGLGVRRTDEKYRCVTLEAARNTLPEIKGPRAALYVLEDKTLRNRLQKNLEAALSLSGSKLNPDRFIRCEAAMESICVPALLHQGKNPEAVLEELDKAAAGQSSKFKTKEWVHHYFFGSIFYLFLPVQRPCILYAGFESFLSLAKGNVRHFLELCHLSMMGMAVTSDGDINPVPPEDQAKAALAASALFVKETQASGDYGNRLFYIVNTLGKIFRLSQSRPSQSEAERTHLAITRGDLDENSGILLSECVKWSVLFVVPETKVKETRLESEEYIFNPIYAPYFGISYNKGRKLEINAEQAKELLTGTRDEMGELVKEYQKNWRLGDPDQMSLFEADSQ
ncbi:hypothetical protein ACQAYK_03895 [Acidithiobacillus sp. AC3]